MLFVIIGTMYGAKGEDREHDVPVTFMIDPEEWFKETFGRPIAVALLSLIHI